MSAEVEREKALVELNLRGVDRGGKRTEALDVRSHPWVARIWFPIR